MIKGANAINEKPVINVSLGPYEYSGNKWLNSKDFLGSKDPKENPQYNPGWQPYNSSNYGSYLDSLTAMLNSKVAGAKDAIIVMSAGNGSTDLSSMLVNKLSIDPIRTRQVIMVGALDASGNIASYSNYSTVSDTMIYVPVTGKTESGLDVSGTSFAAPKLQYLINQIVKERPHLTPEQVRQVLLANSVAETRTIQRPDAPIGEKIKIRVIENPYDPNVLKNALDVADKLFPRLKTSDIQKAKTRDTQKETEREKGEAFKQLEKIRNFGW